jgi:multiple sugar transport system substrate-binding protein
VAPFPSARPGLDRVTYGGMDVLVIPRGSKHKREAFEFIAYVNRQDVTERLNSLHGKLSPRREVSEDFFRTHPNPYIHVFDELAASPNAFPLPPITNWTEIADELSIIAERVNLQDGATEQIIQTQAARAQRKFVESQERARLRPSTPAP